jgi:tRNA(fMet)-specific endonuclease VapC
MQFLLDTHAMIGLLKGTPGRLLEVLRGHAPADVGISSLVVHELYYGAYKSVRREQNLLLLESLRFEVLPFDREDAIAAGEVRAALALAGTPIGPYDVLIAGQALCRQLTLVTSNLGEFRRVAGLSVEDWSQ